MRQPYRVATTLLAGMLFVSGCYGPFNLTRRLYNWNGQINGKWEKEFVFLVLAYVPIYGLAILGDGIVFNSMEFWTGKNPVDAPSRAALPVTKRIVRGDDEAVLTYTANPAGRELLVQQFHRGVNAGSLRMRQQDGMTVGYNPDGRVVLAAQALSDGGVLIRDANGKQVASYSPDQVQQLFESKP